MNFQKMKVKKSELLSKLGLLVPLAVFFLSLYFVFNFSWFKDVFSSGNKVATVEGVENDVRHRSSQEISWYALDRGTDIYENDMVFSGNDSRVLIKFNNGNLFTISPNSLVIFKDQNKQIAPVFKYGEFSSSLAPGKDFQVMICGKPQIIKSFDAAEILIKKETGTTEVSVLEGSVSFKEKIINAGQKFFISEKCQVSDVRSIALELLRPKNQDEIWLKPGEPLEFAWTGSDYKKKKSSSSKKNEDYFITISPKKYLQKPVFQSRVDKQTHLSVEKLSPGRYFWRVVTAGKERLFSKTHEFKIFPEVAVQLTYPPQDTVYTIEKPKSDGEESRVATYPMTFAFEDSSYAESFLFELSNEKDFLSPMISQNINESRLDDIQLPVGEYFWRVKVIDSHRPRAEWSTVGSFSVVDEWVPLHQPILLSDQNIRYTLPPQNHRPFLFSWADEEVANYLRVHEKSVPHLKFASGEESDTENYEVQISDSFLFPETETRRFRSEKSEFNLVSVQPGKYFLRTRAIHPVLPSSPFSKHVNVSIFVSRPELTGREEVSTSEVSLKPKIKLTWKPRVFARFYEVQVSSSGDFFKKRRYFTKNSRFNIEVRPGKNYYYRVRALNQDKQAISLFSKVGMKKLTITPPARRLATKTKSKRRFRSPASLRVPITAEYANWPRWKLEAGSFAGLAQYQSSYSSFSLTNSDLNQNKSIYVSGYYALRPDILINGYYEIISGSVADIEGNNFNTSWAGVGGKYRFWNNMNFGLSAFAGGGMEKASYFRFGFESDISSTIVNRPISLTSVYLTSGLEWRSYYQLRGALSFSYYRGIASNSQASDTTEFELAGNQQYAVDASLSHLFTEHAYLGIGFRYRLINYNFSSNEFGTTDTGSADTSHTLFRVFVGTEQ